MPPSRAARTAPAVRCWYKMRGGPWDRKELAPPVGAPTAEVKIHGRRHLYDLDATRLVGTYRGEPDAGPDRQPYR